MIRYDATGSLSENQKQATHAAPPEVGLSTFQLLLLLVDNRVVKHCWWGICGVCPRGAPLLNGVPLDNKPQMPY